MSIHVRTPYISRRSPTSIKRLDGLWREGLRICSLVARLPLCQDVLSYEPKVAFQVFQSGYTNCVSLAPDMSGKLNQMSLDLYNKVVVVSKYVGGTCVRM